MPCIELDEFGYWTNAILFAGKDWSSITAEYCSYYGYGYGLILALIIKIANDTQIAYQMAIVLNAAMVSSSIGVMLLICEEVVPDIDKSIIIISSSISVFYPSVLMNSQFAWSETILLYCFLLIVLFFVKTINRKKVIYPILLGFFSVYIYMIHQRALGVFLAVLIGILLGYITGNVRKKHMVIFFITILVMLGCHTRLKEYVYENNWSRNFETTIDTEVEMANDYSSQVQNILFCFTVEGIRCFISGFLGKIYYMSMATFFLVWEGFIYLIRNLRKGIKQCNIGIFLLISIFFMLGIATIFLIYPGRIDTVIYGRYTDWLLPVFITLGIIEVIKNGLNIKRFLVYILISTIYLLWFRDIIGEYNLTSYFPTCAPAGNYYRILAKGTLGQYWIELMHIIHCSFLIVVYFMINIFKHKKIRLILVAAFLIFWIMEADSTIENTLFIGRKEEMKKIVNDIRELEKDNIYYLSNNNSKNNLYSGSLQFLLYDTEIECITESEIEKCEEGIVIIPSDLAYNMEKWKNKSYEYFNIFYMEEIQ